MDDEKKVVDQPEKDTPDVSNDDSSRDIDSYKKEIESLRKEAAKYRTRSKEMSDYKSKAEEYEKIIEERRIAEGQYKELYESQKEEVETLKSAKARLDAIEEQFQEKLENEMKNLTETQKEIVSSLQADVETKLNYVDKLKKEMNINRSSPASDRPNLSGAQLQTDIMEKINEEKDIRKRTKMLFELKRKNPELFIRKRGSEGTIPN